MGGHGGSSGYKNKKSGKSPDEIYRWLKSLQQKQQAQQAEEDRRKRREDYLGGDKQPQRGEGVPSYNNTEPQYSHPYGYSAFELAARTGVSEKKAQDFKNALYEDGIGGFTRGWDGVIRAFQRGDGKEAIKKMKGTLNAIKNNFGGDENKFFSALRKKANDCEELIDRSPKWSGGELFRGYNDLSPQTMAALTNTDKDAIINLNAGTASWSTSSYVARNFANMGNNPSGGRLIAHVSGERRGTSIKNGSYYNHEDEVLCSRREAFRCVKTEVINGYTHAWYEVVDTDYDWS